MTANEKGWYPVNLIVQRMIHVAIKLKAESFDDTCTQALVHIAKVATDVRLKLGKDINTPPDLLALFDTLPHDAVDVFRSKKRCRTQS